MIPNVCWGDRSGKNSPAKLWKIQHTQTHSIDKKKRTKNGKKQATTDAPTDAQKSEGDTWARYFTI